MSALKALIIIPALNEEKNIATVLRELKSCISCDVLVINDGSKDATSSVARAEGVAVIDHLYNIGYGGALQTGFKFAVLHDYEYVIQFDGDGQHSPEDIDKILAKLKTNSCDIVIGSRFLSATKNVGVMKGIAIRCFRFLIKLFTGFTITDPTSGLQGLNRKAFSYYAIMGNYPEDFPDADTLIHMLRKEFKVCEIPANIRDRMSGTSMHIGSKTVYYLIKMLVSIFVVVIRDNRTAKTLKKRRLLC